MITRHNKLQAANAIRMISRRDALMLGGAAAGALWLPGGLANAQTTSFDYYIGPNGSDANPGTQSQPWAITALNTKRSTYAGKRVGLLDGVYHLMDIMGIPPAGGFSGNRITVAGGSAASPTIISAINPQKAIISGDRDAIYASSTVDWEAALMGPGGDYVTFDGIRFQQANYRSINNYGGGDYFIVQNCYFTDQFYITGSAQGANSSCVFMQGQNFCKISNCYFDRAGSPSDSNRHAFIQTYACDDFIVEYCTIIGQLSPHRSSNGIHFKGNEGNTSSRPGKRMTVRYCYINNAAVGGATALRWHGNEDTDGYETCHHNVLVTANAPAILSENARNTWLIYNNTFVCNGTYTECGVYVSPGNPLAVNYYNNIISRAGYGSYGDIRSSSIAAIGKMDNNFYDGTPAASIRTVAEGSFNFDTWRSVSGKDGNSMQSSVVQFVGVGSDAAAYKLLSGAIAATLGAGGVEIGAWGGAVQIGASMGRLVAPLSPNQLTVG